MLLITPSSANRQAFARWAVNNRVRTVTSNTFGVPDHLVDEIPEYTLVGGLVDGQPYVPSGNVVMPLEEEPEVLTDGFLASLEGELEPDPEPEPKAKTPAKTPAKTKTPAKAKAKAKTKTT